MEDLRDFQGKNQTLAFKHRDMIIGLLRHCVLFNLMTKKVMKQKYDLNNKLGEEVDARLSLQNNETNESNMLIMPTPWLGSFGAIGGILNEISQQI